MISERGRLKCWEGDPLVSTNKSNWRITAQLISIICNNSLVLMIHQVQNWLYMISWKLKEHNINSWTGVDCWETKLLH